MAMQEKIIVIADLTDAVGAENTGEYLHFESKNMVTGHGNTK